MNNNLAGCAVEINGKFNSKGSFAKIVGKAKIKDKKNAVPKNNVFLSFLKNTAKNAANTHFTKNRNNFDWGGMGAQLSGITPVSKTGVGGPIPSAPAL